MNCEECPGHDGGAQQSGTYAKLDRPQVVSIVINILDVIVLTRFEIFVRVVVVEHFVILLMFLQVLIDDSLLFVQIARSFVFDVDFVVFVLDFCANRSLL